MAKKRGNGEGLIRRREDGRWEARVMVGTKLNGKPHRKSLYGKTKNEVVKKLQELQAKKNNGINLNPKQMSLGELSERWLEHKKERGDIGASAYHQYRNGLNKFKPLFKIKLEKVTALQIDQIYSKLQRDGLSPRTIQIAHNTLNGALKQAVRWEAVSRNVLELVTVPKQVAPEIEVWSANEVVRFLAFTSSHRLHALFHTALATGMRRGELVALRWCDVDVENNRIFVRQNATQVQGQLIVKEPKTKASKRTVQIQEQDMAVLLSHRQRQLEERLELGPAWQDLDLVFPSQVGTHLSPRNLSRLFDGLVKKAEVRSLRLAFTACAIST